MNTNTTVLATILIAIISLSLFTTNAEAVSKIYYPYYGFINADDDSTMKSWKAEIEVAKRAKDSRYKVWTKDTNDWCDVIQYVATDANLERDFQNRWQDANVGKTLVAMRDLAIERRQAVAAVRSVAKQREDDLNRQDEAFIALTNDTNNSDSTVVAFRAAWATYHQQINLAQGSRRTLMIRDFRKTWKSLTDSVITRIDEQAAKQAKFADLEGVVVSQADFEKTIAGINTRLDNLESWRTSVSSKISGFATETWVTENFKDK